MAYTKDWRVVRMSVKFEALRKVQNDHSTKREEWGSNDTKVVKNQIKKGFPANE